jgi:hypothetical protein
MRRDQWDTRLTVFIAERMRRPFAWGSHDCCLMASDWIVELVGIDPAANLRGKYRSAIGALRLLNARNGVIGIARAAAEANGWPEVRPKALRRGDIAAVSTAKEGHALGVCCGPTVAFPGKDGLVFAKITQCTHAWGID